jgi:hypothetical protein
VSDAKGIAEAAIS